MKKRLAVLLASAIAALGLCSMTAFAEGSAERYTENHTYSTIVDDCEIHAYTTTGAGEISERGNWGDTMFPMETGIRVYTAGEKDGWV